MKSASSPLPTSIKVGYRDYAVVPFTSSMHDGECDHYGPLIRIKEELEPTRKANTLLHEALHVAYTNGDLSPGDSEEKVVTVLANQIAQIWRDNPDFVAFISGALK